MTSRGKFIRATLLTLAIVLILAVSISNAQTTSSATSQEQVATVVSSSASKAPANAPVYSDYRGVSIGMTADEVRSKLNGIKKGNGQDFLISSEFESAQIYYDDKKQVSAISIDYIGDITKAPTPETVLGAALEAKADGSMYKLNRYPEAGYWVSYNRTAGDKPIVTITIQKMCRRINQARVNPPNSFDSFRTTAETRRRIDSYLRVFAY